MKNKKKTIEKKKISKTNGKIINIILIIILITGIGWLIYNNKNTKVKDIKIKRTSQVEKFVQKNGEVLFKKAKLEIKKIEKKDNLWRVILDIDEQVQDFYMTIDGRIVQGMQSVEKISNGEVAHLGKLTKKNEIEINDDLKVTIKKFIEKNLLKDANNLEISNINKEHGVIKITTKIQGKDQPLYLTTTGKNLLFGLVSIEKIKDNTKKQKPVQEKKQIKAVSDKNKNNKPTIEYFVMSYCPYGTQFEKGIIPVIKLLGNKIDTKLKFVDYAMHDKKELDENLAQYCIQKEQRNKLYPYLNCFLNSKGTNKDIKNCLTSTRIDTNKLSNCVSSTDEKFKVTKNYNDKSTWNGQYPTFNLDKLDNKKYDINGSPTLVINGEIISSNRDSQSLLKAVCSGFKNAPVECNKKISSVTPSAGFGAGKANGTVSGGGCAQ